jgi:toxin secretion/phage lysis holin
MQKRRNKMNFGSVKAIVLTAFGAAGSFIINVLLGGWTEDLLTLIILMGVDFVMGLLIAAVWKKSGKSDSGTLNSISAWKGLIRKGCSLLVVMVAYRLDVTLGVSYIKTAVIMAFIANEGISIVENYGIMGGPMPKVLKRALEVLQEKADGAGEEEDYE